MAAVLSLTRSLIRRQITLGLGGLDGLKRTLESMEPHDPGFGRCVAQLALWVHLGFDALEFLCEQLDRVTPAVERSMRVDDHVFLELARGVHECMRGKYEAAVMRIEEGVYHTVVARRHRFVRIIARYYMGRCWRRMGRDGLALRAFREASSLATSAGFPAMAAVIHIPEGWLTFHHERKKNAALDLLRGSQEALIATDDVTSKAYLLLTEGRILQRGDDCEPAVKVIEPAVDLLRVADPNHPGLAKALKDLAFAKRLLANQLEREADRKAAVRIAERAALEAVADPLKILARHEMVDEDLLRQAKQPAVEKFLNMLHARAVEVPRDSEDQKARWNRINDLRAQARGHLDEAEQIYLRLTSSRGLGTVALYRGLIDLDEGNLDAAEHEGKKARSHAESKRDEKTDQKTDQYLTVRVEIFQCQVALARFAEEADPVVLSDALALGAAAVAGARALGNDRLLGRALTWQGRANMADATSANRETARACADEATLLFKGSPVDYAQNDLTVLTNQLRGTNAGEQALVDLVREALADLEPAMLQGGKARTLMTYAKYESRLKQTFFDTLLAHLGGLPKFHRLCMVMQISGSKAQGLRARVGVDS